MSQTDDPERLAEATPRSPLAGLFVSAAQDLPSDEQLARLAAQLGPVLNSPPVGPPAGTPLMVKLGVTAGALAVLVGAGLALRRPAPPPAVAPTAPTAPAQVAKALPPAPTPAAAPAPGSAASPDEHSPPASSELAVPGAANAKSSSSTPAKAPSEAALLEQARRALNTAPSHALQLANQHRTLFPHGVLSQEREVIAIEALRRLHRGSEADQRASGFTKAFPGSAHQRMVDEAAPK